MRKDFSSFYYLGGLASIALGHTSCTQQKVEAKQPNIILMIIRMLSYYKFWT